MVDTLKSEADVEAQELASRAAEAYESLDLEHPLFATKNVMDIYDVPLHPAREQMGREIARCRGLRVLGHVISGTVPEEDFEVETMEQLHAEALDYFSKLYVQQLFEERGASHAGGRLAEVKKIVSLADHHSHTTLDRLVEEWPDIGEDVLNQYEAPQPLDREQLPRFDGRF